MERKSAVDAQAISLTTELQAMRQVSLYTDTLTLSLTDLLMQWRCVEAI